MLQTSNAPEPGTERTAVDRWPWLFLVAGSFFRVAWPLDMEWKVDEKWMFAKALAVATGQAPWPWIGVQSGVGLQNPGLGIWPFALLAHFTHDPVAMAQAVQWINVLALWGFVLWVHRTWPPSEQALGLWGCALYAVSPLSVLFSRKIWAQDLLVVLVLPWLWGHRRRTVAWGAALWGFSGALLGQIHMSGFFAAAALLIATLWVDRGVRFNVRAWLAGSAVGMLPMIPWLRFVLSPEAQIHDDGHFSLQFFSAALLHAWGLGLRYSLGAAYEQMLSGPGVAGVATHLAVAAQYALFALPLLVLALHPRDGIRVQIPEPLRMYGACVVIAGLALCAVRVEGLPHYLIVFGPMLHIAAAWTMASRRWAIVSLCGLQAFLAACFLLFVHAHGGAPEGDYGKAYRAQTLEERAY